MVMLQKTTVDHLSKRMDFCGWFLGLHPKASTMYIAVIEHISLKMGIPGNKSRLKEDKWSLAPCHAASWPCGFGRSDSGQATSRGFGAGAQCREAKRDWTPDSSAPDGVSNWHLESESKIGRWRVSLSDGARRQFQRSKVDGANYPRAPLNWNLTYSNLFQYLIAHGLLEFDTLW